MVDGFNRRSLEKKTPQLHNLPARRTPTGPRTSKRVSGPCPLVQAGEGVLGQGGKPQEGLELR